MNHNTAHGIAELETLIRDEVGRRVRRLKVVAVEGGLILKGQSPTYYAKQLAQHALLKATETPILANEIEVV